MLAFVALVALLLFHHTVAALIATWNSSSFSHCYLIPPISLYLAWERRSQFLPIAPRVAVSGFLLLAILGAIWIVGDVADILFVQEFALIAILPALVLTFFGWKVARLLLFPLAFLFFAIPVGLSLISPLQDITANIATKALDLSGVPVVREGRLLVVPNGLWEIAEECSGVRFLIASVTLGTLCAFLLYRSWLRRLIFLAAAVAVPIIANGFRAYGIILLGYLSNNRLAKGVDHIVYGWLFFSFVLIVLLGAGWRWRQRTDVFHLDSAAPAAAGSAAPSAGSTVGTLVLVAIAAIAVLAVAPLSAHALIGSPTANSSISLPPVLAAPPWISSGPDPSSWRPHIGGISADMSQCFRLGERQVNLFVAYNSGGPGTKLVQTGNSFLNPLRWTVESNRVRTIQLDDQQARIEEILFRSASSRRLVWSFYWIDGQFTSSSLRSRLLEAKDRVLRENRAEAAVVISTPIVTDPGDASDLLQDFLNHASVGHYVQFIRP